MLSGTVTSYPGIEMGTTCLNILRSQNLYEPSQKGFFFPSRSGKGAMGLQGGMSAQAATSTIRFRFAFFSVFFPSVFPFLEEIFSVSESKCIIPTFLLLLLVGFFFFYLSPFSCFHLKSDRLGRTPNCFPLETESSPVRLSDVPHYTFGSLKQAHILSGCSRADVGSPDGVFPCPSAPRNCGGPARRCPLPARPAPHRTAPHRLASGGAASRAAALCGEPYRGGGGSRGRFAACPARCSLPENTQKSHGGRGGVSQPAGRSSFGLAMWGISGI